MSSLYSAGGVTSRAASLTRGVEVHKRMRFYILRNTRVQVICCPSNTTVNLLYFILMQQEPEHPLEEEADLSQAAVGVNGPSLTALLFIFDKQTSFLSIGGCSRKKQLLWRAAGFKTVRNFVF